MPFQTVDGIRYLTFDLLSEQVTHAVFTRQGGLSPDPWASLNVGGTVGDDTPRVRENRFRAFRALGRDPHSMFDVWQVHSADVVIATAPHDSIPRELKADGIITDNLDVTLFMRFADCTPILLYDPRHPAVGIVHAGWLGTVRKAASAAVAAMQAAYGSDPADILAAIGPSIGPDHYEVGPEVVEQATHAFGADASSLFHQNSGPRSHFDLWAANRLALRQAGLQEQNIETAGICTACNPQDWYSHRGQKGKTGRFGALIALRG
ncbi:MAG: peptidoglycan editing factor PgeF [Chloroflexi bacterium HGW-Chloroflexi-6]|nr:MAG: peptidoglycan editing factor PgeF [Chloroflexi bacterium HGW-Chloroflexi-6]